MQACDPPARDPSIPAFLRLLDSDPDTAFRLFYEYAWDLLRRFPPRNLRNQSRDVREDVISTTILRCWDHGQRRLREFRGEGKPFSSWLLIETFRRARCAGRVRDRAAKRLSKVSSHRLPSRVEPRAGGNLLEDLALRDAYRASFGQLSQLCQHLLQLKGEGYSADEMDGMLGFPDGWIHKHEYQIHRCRKHLEKLLDGQMAAVDAARSTSSAPPAPRLRRNGLAITPEEP